MYRITYASGVTDDLKLLRARERSRILDQVEVQLTHEPKRASVAGLDAEQMELGSSAEFWGLVSQRRQQKTLTREQLEQEIRNVKRSPAAAGPKKRLPRG